MPIKGVTPKCYILSLFVRDDGERFVLGSGYYEFKDKQMHFKANSVANDIVEVQGNDGYLLAGQVRRPGSQDFDGYVGDGTVDKAEVEQKRRDFLAFFRKNHFYKVVYVFSDGTAIQRKRGFLVDDPTVKELYQIYPEYHVALNFEDVNYYSYAEDEDGEEIYSKIAEIQLTQSVATGGLIWDEDGVVWDERQWGGTPASAGGSTSFTVNNQAGKGAPLASIQLNGDTFQFQANGKNLLNPEVYASGTGLYYPTVGNTISNTFSQYTTSSFTNPTISMANTAADNGAMYLTVPLSTGTYHISMTIQAGANNTARVSASVLDKDHKVVRNIDYNNIAQGGSRTIDYPVTIASGEVYIGVTLDIHQSGGGTVTATNPQVELGSSVTTYEQFIGGTVPNPDYPQAINVVTGEQTVTVKGKNLLPYPYYESSNTSHGIKYTANSDGTITLDGTWADDGGASSFVLSSNSGFTLPAGTYYLPDQPTKVGMVLYDGTTYHSLSVGNNYKLTLSSTTTFRRVYLQVGTINLIKSFDNDTFYPMITTMANPSISDYEPYQSTTKTIDLGSTELAKIGTYVDGIFKNDPTKSWYNPDLEDNAWYVHKATGKATFDGTENWAYDSTIPRIYLPAVALRDLDISAVFPNSSNDLPSGFTNRFIGKTFTNFYSNSQSNGFAMSSVGRNFQVGYKKWQSESEAKSSVNGLVWYYALATPTDTKITDATLTGELEATKALKLYAGENNFLVAASGTNLPGPLDITYYTQVIYPGGAEWSEGAPMGPTTVEVDSIDTVFPVWTVTGPAVNPQLSVLTTNTTFKYNGNVSASQTLVVDMMNKTVLLNGVNMIGNMEGDWASFNPGTNRVMYTTDNTDAEASVIEWQEIVG